MEEESRNERYHVPLFDGTNFSAWRFRMRVLLEEHELLECIEVEIGDLEALQVTENDTAPEKLSKGKLREKRVKKERKCKSLLISRISDSQLEYVQEQTTPKQVWDALGRVFERRSIASRMHLKRQMLSLRLEGGSLQNHFLRFDKLVREYRGTGAEMEELDVICHLLLTLGPAYATVVTALETMPETALKLEFVKCRLLDEEIKQKGSGGEAIPSTSEAAFVGSKEQKERIFKCFNCKQEGHFKADCPTKKEESDKKANKKSKALAATDRGGVCFVGVDAGKGMSSENVQWYIDSGCSDHLVNDAALFEELKPLECPVEIAIAKNGESIIARSSGPVKVMSNVRGEYIECTVHDVLYVPELRCNLFSVMRVDEAGMEVTYKNGKVLINQGSRLVATGSRVGKLYRLDLYSCKAKGTSMLTCGQIPKNLELWHRRFGHLNPRSLSKLILGKMVEGLDEKAIGTDKSVVVCESCVLSKQTRKPFKQVQGGRSSRVLELIHSDVCGPITPVGIEGDKYFVLFVDDYSHFVMAFLMESKDQVFEYFKQYEASVTAKFGTKIGRLRCDNGGEYRSKAFGSFCKQKGIQMEWTVPYTPELNGVSERMNRTLVERVRSMLDDSGVDKRFWGQALQTAAHIVNRSPTSAVNPDVTPFELWEGKKPNVERLRIFGCGVYVHVPGQLRKKLDDKAWKGVFVGYSHNGYRVWDPKSRQIVNVRDVDFLESEVSGKLGTTQKKTGSSSELIVSEEKDADDETKPEEGAVGGDSESVAGDSESDEEFNSFRDDSDATVTPDEQGTPSRNTQNVEARPQRARNVPAWHSDYDVEYVAYALNAMSFVKDLPTSLEDVCKRSDWSKWKAAVNEEMDSLMRNKTWPLVELPPNRKTSNQRADMMTKELPAKHRASIGLV